jgi:hypothetical protein
VSGPDALAAVLDRLLPPNGDLPGAGGLGLAAEILPEQAQPVLDALPAGFAALPAAGQATALRAVEGASPAAFAVLLKFAYIAYYRDPRVLERIERATGYAARPPQPLGYELEPLDPSLLDVVKARAPHYRDTREATR